MVGLAVAPTVSRALAWQAGGMGAGMHHAHAHDHGAMHGEHRAAGPGGDSVPSHHSHTLDHCELCAVAAAACVHVPTVVAAIAAPAYAQLRVARVAGLPPRSRDVWPAAAARGPPRLG